MFRPVALRFYRQTTNRARRRAYQLEALTFPNGSTYRGHEVQAMRTKYAVCNRRICVKFGQRKKESFREM
jgi:hypothetical protein